MIVLLRNDNNIGGIQDIIFKQYYSFIIRKCQRRRGRLLLLVMIDCWNNKEDHRSTRMNKLEIMDGRRTPTVAAEAEAAAAAAAEAEAAAGAPPTTKIAVTVAMMTKVTERKRRYY